MSEDLFLIIAAVVGVAAWSVLHILMAISARKLVWRRPLPIKWEFDE